MPTLASASLLALCAAGVFAAPAATKRQAPGVATIDVSIAHNRADDKYYNVHLSLDGQSLPIMLDTGSGDLFVASDLCPTDDPTDGCFNLQERFVINDDTDVIPGESFFTIVGEGAVYGNNSLLDVGIGEVTAKDLATGLVSESALNEFQNGSFSGIFGLNMRAVSRQLYFNNREPPFDAMLKAGLLAEPKFSISGLPRMGDENPKTGKLTLGGIGPEFEGRDIAWGEIYSTPNYNIDDFPLDRQGWTIRLEGIRVNGAEVNMTRGSLLPTGEYLSFMDSGSWGMLFRPQELDQIAALMTGPTIYQVSGDLFFACDIPQLIELKYFGQWYAVDPLDLVVPNDHGNVNGTEMCHSTLGRWTRTFGDSIIGVPFFRNVDAVFDYVQSDLVPQPRVGLASDTDGAAAMAAYPGKIGKRLVPRS